MAWDVINVHDYSIISDFNYLVNQFDGVLISTCYRDGYSGLLKNNSKFFAQLSGFLDYTERIRVGYYIKSTAIDAEEIQQELSKQDEIIAASQTEYPDKFVNDFPVFIELCWTDSGYMERISGLTIDYQSIFDAIKAYREEKDVKIGIIIDVDQYTTNVEPYSNDFYDYRVLYKKNTRPLQTIDAWQYVKNVSITTADKHIDKSTYYTDVADFANLPSNNIGYYITGLKETSYDYDYGNPIRPEVINPKDLVYGLDYIMYCTDNVNAGAAKAFIEGVNAFSGTVVYDFNINRVDLGYIESIYPTTFEYDGKPHEPDTVVKNLIDRTIERNVDYTVRYENNINAGEATCIVEGKGNYIGRLTAPFNIGGSDFYISARLAVNSYEYTHEPICPKPSVVKHYKYGDLYEGIHYVLEYENNIEVGENAKCIICGIGNFLGGRKELPFSIIRADIRNNNWIRGLQDWEFVYNGKEHEVVADTDLVEYEDYILEDISEDTISAGVKTVLIKGINNFTEVLELNYEILPQEIPPEDRWHAFPEKYVYRGTPCEPGVVYTPGYHYEVNPEPYEDDDTTEFRDVDFGDQDDPEDLPPTGEDDNSANFQDIDDPDYVPPDPEDEDPDWNFGEMPDIWILVPDPDLVLGRDYILIYDHNEAVGTGQVIVQGIGNFTGHVSCDFEIVPDELNPNYFNFYPEVFVYNGEEQRPMILPYEGLVEGVDFTVAFKDNINAGFGKAIITGIGNLKGECIKQFRIDPADLNDVAEITCGEPVAYNYVYDNDNFAVTLRNGGGNLVMYDDYYYRFETIIYPVNSSYTQTTWICWGLRNYGGTITKTFITTRDGWIPDVPERYRPKEVIDPSYEEDEPIDEGDDEAEQKSEAQKEAEERDYYFTLYDSYYDDKGNHIWHPDKYILDPEPKLPEDPTKKDEDPPEDMDIDFYDIDDPDYIWPDPDEEAGAYYNFGDIDRPAEIKISGDFDFGDQDAEPDYDIIQSVYYKSGAKISLLDTSYYSSPVNFYKEPGTLTGVFYIYNYKIYNGKIRVTNSLENVNVVGKCVGWVNIEDILFVGLNVKLGDQVRVINYIYQKPEGDYNGIIYKRNEIMTVVVFVDSTDFNFGDIDTDKDYEITQESYDFGDLDYPDGYPEEYVETEDNYVELEDNNEEDETHDEISTNDSDEDEIPDSDVEYLPKEDEEEYPLDEDAEDEEDFGYDFNELAMVVNTDNGRYPIGLSNTPNGYAVGYADTTMFTKLNLVAKTLY